MSEGGQKREGSIQLRVKPVAGGGGGVKNSSEGREEVAPVVVSERPERGKETEGERDRDELEGEGVLTGREKEKDK